MTRRIVIILFFLLGIGLMAQGLWIPAKAQLAQWLLQDAWHKTLADGADHKPWSWADHWPVAQLSVPGLSIEQIVLAGDSGNVLAFAPGLNRQAAKPGEGGTVVISGHRDTHFKFLQYLQDGQQIVLMTTKQQAVYEVTARQVVNADTTRIDVAAETDQLLLVTCYPFNSPVAGGPLRYVVSARPVLL